MIGLLFIAAAALGVAIVVYRELGVMERNSRASIDLADRQRYVRREQDR